MKSVYECIISSYSLLANPLEDELIMGIIGIIAYLIAYRAVGKLYDYNIISGRKSGSIVHWIIRLLVWMIIFNIAKTLVEIYRWFDNLSDYKWWVICSIFSIAFVVKIAFYVRKYRKAEMSRGGECDEERH